MDEPKERPSGDPSYLYVQTAHWAQLELHEDDSSTDHLRGTLTLRLVDRTIGFSDRPRRFSYFLPTAQFVEYWKTIWHQDLSTTPPNAELVIFGHEEPANATLELSNPKYEKPSGGGTRGDVIYEVLRVIGRPPNRDQGGPAALFIDDMDCDPNMGCMSDLRLKKCVTRVATLDNSIKIYSFKYLWSNETYVGVMAQDLLLQEACRSAVRLQPSGFYEVDYAALGLKMTTLDDWMERGISALLCDSAARHDSSPTPIPPVAMSAPRLSP